jgi:hypothetical protein
MLTSDLEALGVTVQMVGSLVRNDYIDPATGTTRQVRYEGRGGWRYRTLVGLESQFAWNDQIIPESQTKSEWVLGVDGDTMTSIRGIMPGFIQLQLKIY